MALPMIAAGVTLGLGALSFMDSRNNAKMIEMASEFRAKQLEYNSILVGMQEREIFDQANQETLQRESMARQMVGAQKASFAAQNVQLDSEISGQFAAQEQEFSAQDVATIRNNAWREAMGLQIQAQDLRSQAAMTRLEGKSASRQTIAAGQMGLLGSAVDAASMYSSLGGKFSKKTTPKTVKPKKTFAYNYTGSNYGSTS